MENFQLAQFPATHPLVGIARLAAQSPQVRCRADVEYFSLETRSALNRESSGRMPFAWTLNPYRGCEFACVYCYARYAHEFMEMWEPRDFEQKIYAKAGTPELLRQELRRAKDRGQAIALGTATDPYQPAEREFEITRRMLQALAEFEGLDLSITTKSVLILRDLDLLQAIAAKHRFSVHMTVTTTDERLARRLEPKAPPPAKRLEAVRQLAQAGVHAGVNAMPILPGLNDSRRALERLAQAAAAARAQFLYGNLLFLKPSAWRRFMPFLEEEFPELVSRYRQLYGCSAYLRGPYADEIARLIRELRERYRLNVPRPPAPPCSRPCQLSLPCDL